jgi:hypothetical protein
MPTERTCTEILAPYDGRIFVWGGSGPVSQGVVVGAVGQADNYAILLSAPEDAPDRFLWVQNGEVTAPMAHQPLNDRNVFDARGRYLGRGGEALDRTAAVAPIALIDAIPTRRKETEPAPAAAPSMATYVFPLRRGLLVTVELPSDLTQLEADRFGDFLKLLPVEGTR